MAALSSDRINSLVSRGAKRWRKNGMDRLYLPLSATGLYIPRNPNEMPNICGHEVSRDAAERAKTARIWVSVDTGEIGVKFPSNGRSDGLSKRNDRRLETYMREGALMFLSEVIKQSEMDAADRKHMSIAAASAKWRVGTEIRIDDRDYVVTRVDTFAKPSDDKAAMMSRARLVVRQFDGRCKRFDLDETFPGDGRKRMPEQQEQQRRVTEYYD